jgi:hypothetical protein
VRYLLLSAAIVFGTAVLASGWANRDLIRIRIASVYARVKAPAGKAGTSAAATVAPLSGDAPWALSALPDCLTQISESNGSLAYVRAHLPARAVAIVPPATLVYGDCSIAIDGDEAYVKRGVDRLRIPPPVRFYRTGNVLALERKTAGGAELRIYQPTSIDK